MNNNEELFNEKEFETANKGLKHIQKYEENKEAVELFLDMFEPSEELIEQVWDSFGKPFIISALLADDNMISILNNVKDNYELLEPPFDFMFLAKTAMEINGSEMSEKMSDAISEGTKGEAILQQILFQYGADQS